MNRRILWCALALILLTLATAGALAEGEWGMEPVDEYEMNHGVARYYQDELGDCIQIDGSRGTRKIRDAHWFAVEPEGVYFLRANDGSEDGDMHLYLAPGDAGEIQQWGVVARETWHEIVPFDGKVYVISAAGDSMWLGVMPKGRPLEMIGVIGELPEMYTDIDKGKLWFYRTEFSLEPSGYYDPGSGRLWIEPALQGAGFTTLTPGSTEYDIVITASSTLKSSGKNTYDAKNVFDDDLATAWVEGADGDGCGEVLYFTFDHEVELGGFQIYAGYGKSPELYKKNNRVKTLYLYGGSGEFRSIRLDDVQQMQVFELDEPLLVTGLGFVIYDTYPGTAYDDTCISEINLMVREPSR